MEVDDISLLSTIRDLTIIRKPHNLFYFQERLFMYFVVYHILKPKQNITIAKIKTKTTWCNR